MDQADRDRIAEIQKALSHIEEVMGLLAGKGYGNTFRAKHADKLVLLTDRYIALSEELSRVTREMWDFAEGRRPGEEQVEAAA